MRHEISYIESVKKRVREVLDSETQSVSHRFDHIQRVLKNAQLIATHYPEVDMELLTIAILLHDIEQPFNDKENHVNLSVKKAEEILRDVEFPADRIRRVIGIISEHSTEHVDEIKPTTIEAKITFDADKVDGLGAIGIARVFSLFGQLGRGPLEAVSWYRAKIDKALLNMQTEIGKDLFLDRLGYVEDFLNRLESEADGG